MMLKRKLKNKKEEPMELPRLENGVLHIGDSELVLWSCNLDMLIEAFGFPEACYYLVTDARFVMFKFQHHLGNLLAFVFFQQENTPIVFELEDYLLVGDRGSLVELQIELDEFFPIETLEDQPKEELKNGAFKFILFSGKFLGRVFNELEIDAISFLNPQVITSAEKSFMYGLVFWPDSGPPLPTQLYLNREAEKGEGAEEGKKWFSIPEASNN